MTNDNETNANTQISEIERTLTDLLNFYADLREEYIHGDRDNYHGMNETDKALANEVNGIRIAAQLVSNHRDVGSMIGLPSWQWSNWERIQSEHARRLDAMTNDNNPTN